MRAGAGATQPVTVAGAAIVLVTSGIDLAALVLGWEPALQAAASVFGSAAVTFAALAWAHARVTPTARPTLARGTEVTVEGTDDKVEIQPTPPGPVGMPDAAEDEDELTGGQGPG